MERRPVSSASVASVGYDPEAMTLELEFSTGSVYQYFDVPQVEYEALLGAVSIGAFVNENIRGKYRYGRL